MRSGASVLDDDPPSRPIVRANRGARPPQPSIALRPAPPAAALPLVPDDAPDVAVDLSALLDIPWTDLDHAYGPASDVPELINTLAQWPTHAADVLDELLGDALLHQGSCYSATAPAMPFLAKLAVTRTTPARHRLTLHCDLLYAAQRKAATLIADADRAAATGDQPMPAPWTDEVHTTIDGQVPTLLAHWAHQPPAVQFILAALAAVYPAHGQAVASHAAALAAHYAGTQPGAYLQLATALINTDDDHALALAQDIVAWHDDVNYTGLDAPGIPPAQRAASILVDGSPTIAATNT